MMEKYDVLRPFKFRGICYKPDDQTTNVAELHPKDAVGFVTMGILRLKVERGQDQ